MARKPKMSGVFDFLFGKAQPKLPPGPPPPIHINLYEVLGVPKDVSDEELRSAFRDLAMKFHPDRNPGDPVAERRFREIGEAYAILSQADRRAAYDRLRKASGSVPPPVPASRAIVPVPERQQEQQTRPRGAVPPPPGAPKTSSMWEVMFGPPEEEGQERSLFEMFTPGQPTAPRVPSAESPFGWAAPFSRRVPLTPGLDLPTPQEVEGLVKEWPLEGWWSVVKGERQTPEFQRAGAMAVDALAGMGQRPAEWDLAEIFQIPVQQVDEFVKHRGRDAFYGEVLYPIFNVVTQVLDQLKPSDIPGRFFLAWDPSGRVIELIYAENAGRRPG